MKFPGGEGDPLAHAAIHHHTQNFERLAAIGVATAARKANLAIHVWLDRTTVARFDVGNTRSDRDHLHSQFVPGNPGIREERHLAEITRVVCAADPNAVNADEGVTRPRIL